MKKFRIALYKTHLTLTIKNRSKIIDLEDVLADEAVRSGEYSIVEEFDTEFSALSNFGRFEDLTRTLELRPMTGDSWRLSYDYAEIHEIVLDSDGNEEVVNVPAFSEYSSWAADFAGDRLSYDPSLKGFVLDIKKMGV